MKNAIRKITASVICGALLVGSAAGCADTSWSVKNDDETLSVGTYIYYLTQAYSEAKEKSGKSGNNVLSETIDKKTGDEWIRDRAKELCVEQLTLDKLCKDNKIEISDADIDAAYNDKSAFYGYYSYSDMWVMSKQNYESMGISEDSYKNAIIKTALAKDKLFNKLYDEGGTQAVSDKDIEKYFTENYVSYSYFTTSLNSTDEEGKSTTMSDEEKEVVKVRYERYAKIINEQNGTTDDVVEQYNKDYPKEDTNTSGNESGTESSAEASGNESSTESSAEASGNESSTESSAEASGNESSTESSAETSGTESGKEESSSTNNPLQTSLVDLSNENFVDGEDVKAKLKEMNEGEAAYVATASEYYFLYKMPIADKVSTALSKDDANSYRSTVLHSIKDKDFEKYIEEQAKKISYEQNDSAFSKYTPSRVIPDSDNSVESSTESTASKADESSTESTASKADESSTESTASKADESSTESTASKTDESSVEAQG